MTIPRKSAACYLGAMFVVALSAGILAPHDYAGQFRDHIGEPPSSNFLLGTDDLGRDRFSRLLFAMRVSLVMAPATAALTTVLVAVIGLLSGWRGGWFGEGIMVLSDLLLSLPLLFLVLTLRALLPLNVSPEISVAALPLVLAAVGWPTGARVIRAVVSNLRSSPSVLQARAYGSGMPRLFAIQILPNLRSPLSAQFWILVPAFLTAEANLGILGLGVSEPIPSLGNLLAELRDYQRIPEEPWILIPAVFLVLLLTALHAAVSGGE
jgi:peptide/nickel transport system permease protein